MRSDMAEVPSEEEAFYQKWLKLSGVKRSL